MGSLWSLLGFGKKQARRERSGVDRRASVRVDQDRNSPPVLNIEVNPSFQMIVLNISRGGCLCVSRNRITARLARGVVVSGAICTGGHKMPVLLRACHISQSKMDVRVGFRFEQMVRSDLNRLIDICNLPADTPEEFSITD